MRNLVYNIKARQIGLAFYLMRVCYYKFVKMVLKYLPKSLLNDIIKTSNKYYGDLDYE